MLWKILARNLKRDMTALLLIGFTLYFVGINAQMNREVDPNMHKHGQAIQWETHHHFMRDH